MSPNDLKKREQNLNPGQADADRRFSDSSGSHDSITGYDRNSDRLDDHPVSGGSADGINPNNNRDKVLAEEQVAQKNREDSFTNNVKGSSSRSQGSRLQRFRGKINRNKGKSATIGFLGGFGIIGILFTLIAPSSLLISLTENLVSNNNGAESAFQRRIVKVLGSKLSDQDGVCNTKRVKCKMGRISTKGLKTLEKKGIIALDSNDNKLSSTESKYPDKRIAKYKVDGFDNPIPSGKMKEFLVSEPKLAAKLLGRSGAFNLRFELWKGKYFNKKFFSKWSNISRSGGIADGENKRNSKASNLLSKVKEKIPGLDQLNDNAQAKISTKTEKLVKRGKRGGVGYLAAVGSCIGVKTPSIIASGVASVQVARLMPLVSNMILSPGSKNKASFASGITSDDVSAAGTALTATDKNNKSALDSKYLQSALGINKNKTGPSEDFSPGYSILNNATVKGFKDTESASESSCNAVFSPQAMYSAIAVDSAVTVVASATLVGGLAKVAGSWAIGEVVGHVIQKIVEKGGAKVIESLAKNDELDKVLGGAGGEKFGDALGISGMLFFSSTGAAHNVPVLKESQLTDYTQIQSEQANFQREMDLASLSPFDISSKYTFLGSIMNSFNTVAITHGGYNSSFFSSLATSPIGFLSNTALASTDTYDKNYCGYAKDFSMESDGDQTPAVNAAGLPCYGYTGNISVDSAVSIAEKDGWIQKEAGEESDIEDLAVDDSRLADYLSGCGSDSIESGEWTETAAGCTIDTASSSTKNIPSNKASCKSEETPEADGCFDNTDNLNSTTSKSSTPDESEAVAAFSMDYQLSQSIDGFDDETFANGNGLSVMTHNILGESQGKKNGNDGGLSMTTRANAAISIIKIKQPAIIGLQEVNDSQFNYIIPKLDGYESWPKTSKGPDQPETILWDTSKLEKVDGGTYKYPKNQTTSTSPWVKLKSRSGSGFVYVFNTHPTAQKASYGPGERKRATEVVLKEIKKVNTDNSPVIITGDFNSTSYKRDGNDNSVSTSDLPPSLYKAAGYTDTHDLAGIKTNDDYKSSHGDAGVARKKDNRSDKQNKIDHIFVSSQITASTWENVIDDSSKTASDHTPLIASLAIPGFPQAGAEDANQALSAGGSIKGDDYKTECSKYLKGPFYCPGERYADQCTAFVNFRLFKHNVISSTVSGNGKDIASNLGKRGFAVNTTPAVNSVFSTSQTSQRQLGHTGMVSKVNPDGSIVVEEYNFVNSKAYGTRTVKKSEYTAKNYTFAHTEKSYK